MSISHQILKTNAEIKVWETLREITIPSSSLMRKDSAECLI